MERICPDKPVKLLRTHCLGHQLALICEHAAKEVDYWPRFEAALLQGWIFIHYSAVRNAAFSKLLKEIQLTDVTLLRSAVTRWLSRGQAVEAQRATLAALIRAMQAALNNLSGDKKSDLQGWIATYRTFRYFATLYFMCDVLPAVNTFCVSLQKRGLTFSRVMSAYNAVTVRLESILESQVNTLQYRTSPDFGPA